MKALAGALVVAWCLVAVPVAAAAPVNDHFADAEVLGAALPVQVERSNYGATKEAGEPAPAFSYPSGHSVWFKWKAPNDAFVTVNTCQPQSYFDAVLGVYTGTALGALIEVAGSFASEGPDCPEYSGQAVSFRATAGVEYAILVDGFPSFPEPSGESGQGFFRLNVAALPAPANDDFADAAVLTGQVQPNGAYSAGMGGAYNSYNWGAGKEPGEPAHAGDPGGASVWYAWRAPFTGRYVFSGCGRFAALVGVYAGDSVASLTPVTANNCTNAGITLVDATAGTTYRIAVDGHYDSGSGLPAMGSFAIGIYLDPPAPPSLESPRFQEAELPLRKRKPIDTVLRKRVISSERRSATFRFGANDREARFRCQLDKRMPTWCKSPKTYEHLSIGRHAFKVIAIDTTSSGDGTPPVAKFRIREVSR